MDLDPVGFYCFNASCGAITYYDVERISDFLKVSGGLSTCSEHFGDNEKNNIICQINITAARKCFIIMYEIYFLK